ncbi:hypothetical protein C8J57DRAFT_1473154 [Mycena rebaudengoi]|nr:hypothetical protein C8J57DRAFT_1473154 [Mycena rebaudengoi]
MNTRTANGWDGISKCGKFASASFNAVANDMEWKGGAATYGDEILPVRPNADNGRLERSEIPWLCWHAYGLRGASGLSGGGSRCGASAVEGSAQQEDGRIAGDGRQWRSEYDEVTTEMVWERMQSIVVRSCRIHGCEIKRESWKMRGGVLAEHKWGVGANEVRVVKSENESIRGAAVYGDGRVKRVRIPI